VSGTSGTLIKLLALPTFCIVIIVTHWLSYGLPALATGLTLVSAMAIQNAAQRIHLSSSPPTTLMTGTTAQIMIDVEDMMRSLPADKKNAARARLARMTASVLAFAFGCAAAALFYSRISTCCFLIPPLLGLGTLAFRMAAFEGDVR
jgi:uncharacterized membrane protein YoaK (UPF0700 family)